MTYYYTYKITCLKGGLKDHYYYGQHHTDDLNDGYCGSGAIIRKYYKKYGAIENVTYVKDIISFYSNSTELNEAEITLIGDNYKNDPMCLNITHGSYKEWTEEARKNSSESAKQRTDRGPAWNKDKHMPEGFGDKISNYFKEHGHPFQGKHHTEETKKKMSEKAIGRNSAWKGRHHSDETRKELSEKAKQRQKRKWITNGIDEFLINTDQIDSYLQEGYKLGRILSIWGVNKTKKPDSEETRFKKGASSRNHKWMNNGIIQKQISLEEVEAYLKDGWIFGYVKHKNITN